MTRDDIIRMAREAGMLIPSFRIGGGLALGTCTVPDFERFAGLGCGEHRLVAGPEWWMRTIAGWTHGNAAVTKTFLDCKSSTLLTAAQT